MSALHLEKFTVRLGSREIIQNVSLSLEEGKIIGLIGPNGAGKSTLLRALSGIIPSTGSARIGETELSSLKSFERAKQVTYVGAELETDFPLTAFELVSLGTYAFGTEVFREEELKRIEETMRETGCLEFRDRFLSDLSSGERQRVHLARALTQRPKWIFLDESFSRLDLHHQAKMGALLRTYLARGISFLFVSHDLNFTTDWADRCVLMKDGILLHSGETKEVVTIERMRAIYPDAEVTLSPHPVTGAMKVYFKG